MTGALMLVGLILTAWPVTWALSLVLRSIGAVLSVFLWAAIGISFLLASPNVLTAGPVLNISVLSLWVLLRTPVLPRSWR